MGTTEQTSQQDTICRLGAEWGDTFVVRHTTADGTVIVGRASDHSYYEPSPVRYRVATDGTAAQIDSDGDEIENEDYLA